MKTKPLYNNLFTLISEKHIDIKLPDNFIRYEGELSKVVNKIESKQLNSDQMYNGHIIVWSNKINSNTYEKLFKKISSLNFNNNRVYVTGGTHHGEYLKCTIDSDYLVCSSYMLPFIAAESRTNATRYGNILLHRGTITNLDIKTFL